MTYLDNETLDQWLSLYLGFLFEEILQKSYGTLEPGIYWEGGGTGLQPSLLVPVDVAHGMDAGMCTAFQDPWPCFMLQPHSNIQ